MKNLLRASLVLLLVAAAGCTSGHPRAPHTTGSATPTLPPFPTRIAGTVLLKTTGTGSGHHSTSGAEAGNVTAEVLCAGNGDIKTAIEEPNGHVLVKVVSQPCRYSVIHKLAFKIPAEPSGMTVDIKLPSTTRYALLITEK